MGKSSNCAFRYAFPMPFSTALQNKGSPMFVSHRPAKVKAQINGGYFFVVAIFNQDGSSPSVKKGRGERSKKWVHASVRHVGGTDSNMHSMQRNVTPTTFPVTILVVTAQVLCQHVPPRAEPPPHHPPRRPHNPRLHKRARSAPFEPPQLPAAPKIAPFRPPPFRIPLPGEYVPELFCQEILPPGLVSPAAHARDVGARQSF